MGDSVVCDRQVSVSDRLWHGLEIVGGVQSSNYAYLIGV